MTALPGVAACAVAQRGRVRALRVVAPAVDERDLHRALARVRAALQQGEDGLLPREGRALVARAGDRWLAARVEGDWLVVAVGDGPPPAPAIDYALYAAVAEAPPVAAAGASPIPLAPPSLRAGAAAYASFLAERSPARDPSDDWVP
ncbi:MAG: hypothetical protein H6745_26030 [Deltaproteobacteria bacterium]|nr:hypothetical protein [Deltaproteobacteria bacterium]